MEFNNQPLSEEKQEHPPFDIRSAFGTEKEWLTSIPEQFLYHPIPCHQQHLVHGEWGYFVFQVTYLQGIQMWDSQYYLRGPTEMSGAHNAPFIEQHNSVINHFQNDWDGITLPTEKEGQGGFSVGPYLNNTVHFPRAGYYRTTDFHFDPAFLNHFTNAYPELDRLLNLQEGHRFAQASRFLTLRGDPSVILRHIYNPHCRQEMQDHYLQLKAEELLICSLEGLHAPMKKKAPPPPGRLEEIGQIAVQLLQQHYREPLRLPELARLAATNEEYLRLALKQQTGQTIIGYLTTLRIQKAKALLLDTALSLDEIALESGFRDADRLGRVFKQHTGVTPISFRVYGGKPS